MQKEIKCNISKSTQIIIRANSEKIDLGDPLYAINWFSTKVEWLYHLYNMLASGSVGKVGGRAFFKGKVTETVLDEANAARELILIVRYPNGQSFKALLGITFFKIVSILRVLAVKDFTFGFTHKQILDKEGKLNDGLFYAVHHFKFRNADDDFLPQFEAVLGGNIKIKYAGTMAANLFSQKDSKPSRQVPNLMDGILLFEAKSQENISKMLNTAAYQAIIQELESSYISFIKRIF